MKLELSFLPGRLGVCRLNPENSVPSWINTKTFFSITKTADELSIIAPQKDIPKDAGPCEKNWRAIKVEGPLDFSLTGILSSLAAPLARAKISIFAVSTYDTDYILVKDENLKDAVAVLSEFCIIRGHSETH